MFKRLFGKFSKDMGLDLGTTNTLVYVSGKGILMNEPSVIAINTKTDQILAIGEEAVKMLGKTPPHITATRPLAHGIISDFEAVEKMLGYFIDKVHKEGSSIFAHPRIITSTPIEITGVEKKAIEDAALQAGARKVYLIEEPLAAAIGARLPIQEATGSMIVNIGGGLTEVAVISLGGIVTGRSLTIAGEELNKNLIHYVQSEMGILLGEGTAEQLKLRIGSAYPTKETYEAKVRGRDITTGLPREAVITDGQVREALQRPLKALVESLKDVLEMTPPELVAEIYQKGIVLCGGTALLRGIDKYLSAELRIPANVVDDPQTAVIRGIGIVLENFEQLKGMLTSSIDDEIDIR